MEVNELTMVCMQILTSNVISALKMAGQIEKMPQCGKCSRFIPNMVNRLGLPLFALTNDCKNHVPEIREKPKRREKPKKA